jgi:hypothetical protein
VRVKIGLTDALIRWSGGREDEEDRLADLEQALNLLEVPKTKKGIKLFNFVPFLVYYFSIKTTHLSESLFCL